MLREVRPSKSPAGRVVSALPASDLSPAEREGSKVMFGLHGREQLESARLQAIRYFPARERRHAPDIQRSKHEIPKEDTKGPMFLWRKERPKPHTTYER